MTELEIRHCQLWNLRTGVMAEAEFAAGETYPEIFGREDDCDIEAQLVIGGKDSESVSLFFARSSPTRLFGSIRSIS